MNKKKIKKLKISEIVFILFVTFFILTILLIPLHQVIPDRIEDVIIVGLVLTLIVLVPSVYLD